MNPPISIIDISSLSPLGGDRASITQHYNSSNHFISNVFLNKNDTYASSIAQKYRENINTIRQENSNYKHLDDTVLYAIFCGRALVKNLWEGKGNIGINIGSSRGATGLFESHYKSFMQGQPLSPYTSPVTTLGNISSWVANDLRTQGICFSHSITCSTALHAFLNGVAWLSSGLSDYFIAGASEAPLTSFTIAQMQALKLYASYPSKKPYPCRAFDLEKKNNTLILGEGACLVALEKGYTKNALAILSGIGFATEHIQHGSSISQKGECLKKSMSMALSRDKDVDVIVMHTPGTLQGDLAEYNAIKSIFGEQLPALTTNKWKIGHTFGASGGFSLEMAIIMLQTQKFFHIPYIQNSPPKSIRKVLVNAVGFGGNAVSILLSIP